ncbi:MAG: ParA family protein [Solirubrobacteraceae bacterium]
MIALANHKGGVTKTTSTANLGAMLAERRCRVLIVDCDPQANLSEVFGWSEDLDVRGAGKLYDLVESELPDLRIVGVLIAASERRWRVTRDAAARMHADDMRVLSFEVPRAVRVASAPRYRAPIAVLEPDSIVTQAYRQLAEHIARERWS